MLKLESITKKTILLGVAQWDSKLVALKYKSPLCLGIIPTLFFPNQPFANHT